MNDLSPAESRVLTRPHYHAKVMYTHNIGYSNGGCGRALASQSDSLWQTGASFHPRGSLETGRSVWYDCYSSKAFIFNRFSCS